MNFFCFSLVGFAESERAERERKGDLDQYERLDGDRNQTSKYLAVKKVAFAILICSLTRILPERNHLLQLF